MFFKKHTHKGLFPRFSGLVRHANSYWTIATGLSQLPSADFDKSVFLVWQSLWLPILRRANRVVE